MRWRIDDGWQEILWNTLLQPEEFDAFATVGRGRVIDPRYQFTVRKTQTGTTVSKVRFFCTIEDLYDFNYEDDPLPQNAAGVQIGYGRGLPSHSARNFGKIYRTQIQIVYDYNEPFTYLSYANPTP